MREGSPLYEQRMDGPAELSGLKPFPLIQPTIQIRKESYLTDYEDLDRYNEEDEDEDDELQPEDMDTDR
ncbi:MAG: hypothetical protein NVSMB44_16660 [Ktedonobacteraceae bacterium]